MVVFLGVDKECVKKFEGVLVDYDIDLFILDGNG